MTDGSEKYKVPLFVIAVLATFIAAGWLANESTIVQWAIFIPGLVAWIAFYNWLDL